jgi:predicted deacylase
MSGVHGVEGFVASALQCDLVERLGPGVLPDDVGVLVVHAVNPWGMAWGRRQNEHNVDLNRNWRRDEIDPVHNDAYDELHPLACPDSADLPSVDDLMAAALELVERKGLPWVRDGITTGQYRHPDGLHFGGDRTEESNRIVQHRVVPVLEGVEQLLVLDLHTGHGPWGQVTFLSDLPPDSDQHAFFTSTFPGVTVEATAANPDATTGTKSGQIANGIRAMLPGAEAYSTSVEFGTVADEEQLVATHLESWVDRHGDRSRPEHAAVAWAYRCCFTPDDREWESRCLDHGGRVLSAGLEAVGARPPA